MQPNEYMPLAVVVALIIALVITFYFVAKVETLREQLVRYRAFLDFVESAPVSSGVCCCGDDMSKHESAYSAGHTPKDQWHWQVQMWCDELKRFEV